MGDRTGTVRDSKKKNKYFLVTKERMLRGGMITPLSVGKRTHKEECKLTINKGKALRYNPVKFARFRSTKNALDTCFCTGNSVRRHFMKIRCLANTDSAQGDANSVVSFILTVTIYSHIYPSVFEHIVTM